MKKFSFHVVLVLAMHAVVHPAFSAPSSKNFNNRATDDGEISISGPSSEAISETDRADAISTDPAASLSTDTRNSDSNDLREIVNPNVAWPLGPGSPNNGNSGNKPPSRPSPAEVDAMFAKLDAKIKLAQKPSTGAPSESQNVAWKAGEVAVEGLGKTHNNDGAPRRSFADAMRMIGRGSRLIQKNLVEAQKAYSEGGVLGIADYVATLPDFWAQPSAIDFLNVSAVRGVESSTVNAAISKALPLNGPPFVFNLANVLPTILEQVLEFRNVVNEKGENVKVVAFNHQRHVLLNVTSVS